MLQIMLRTVIGAIVFAVLIYIQFVYGETLFAEYNTYVQEGIFIAVPFLASVTAPRLYQRFAVFPLLWVVDFFIAVTVGCACCGGCL